MKRRRIIVCADCGQRRRHHAHGRCNSCYMRRYRTAHRGAGKVAARIADYAELRGHGETREAACARLGISTRTAQRYEARLRRQEAAA